MNVSTLEQEAAAAIPAAVPPPRYARKPQLPALTGIRTLLALGIVLFHFTPPHLGILYPLVDNAYVFVGVFFLISGYVLTYNYGDRGRNLNKRDFWIARVARLYPVYLFILLISFPMLLDEWHVRAHAEFWQGLILTPLLLQGLSPSLATFWNTVAWTLSCEAVLYIGFPWIIRVPWPKTTGRLIALLLAVWAIGLIPHSLYTILNPDHLAGPVDRYSSTEWIRFLKFTPLPYVATFLSGIILAKIHFALKFTVRQRMLLAAASLAALAVFFYALVPKTSYLLMHGGLLTPIFGALILGLSAPHWITSCFSWRPLLLIGESSYCLYLLHFNLYQLIHRNHVFLRLHLIEFDPWLSYAVIILASLAIYQFYENPVRKLILDRFRPASRRPAPASA